MAVPASAKQPLIVAAVLGVCVLGADVLVLRGLFGPRPLGTFAPDGGLVTVAVIAALALFVLWAIGGVRALRFLGRYQREAAALPEVSPKLTELAKDAEQRVADGAKVAPRSLSPDTPLLDRRIMEAWRALRRGAAPGSGGSSNASARPFPGVEREFRIYIDSARVVGVIAAVAAVLVTLSQYRAPSSHPVYFVGSSLPPVAGHWMIIAFTAILAATSLRIFEGVVQDEQDRLAVQVDDTVSDYFIASLPKSLTSPEDRLAAASEQLAQDTREILEYSYEKHNAGTQKMLTAQAAQSDSLLKEHALLIGQALTKQIQQPIEKLAENTAAFARQSAAWTTYTTDLKAANAELIKIQQAEHERHEAAMTTLAAQHRASLNDFLEVARQANHVVMIEMQEATTRQIQEHAAAAEKHLATYRDQFQALLAEQEAAHRRVTEAALVSIGGAIDARLAAADGQVAATLSKAGNRLPDLLRGGVKEGLDETVALLEALREQAASLAHTIAQVSGNADRQLLAYERWQERANEAQVRLEEVVSHLPRPN